MCDCFFKRYITPQMKTLREWRQLLLDYCHHFKLSAIGTRLSLGFVCRKAGSLSFTDGDSSIGNVHSDRRVQRQVSWVFADILAYFYFLFAEYMARVCSSVADLDPYASAYNLSPVSESGFGIRIRLYPAFSTVSKFFRQLLIMTFHNYA
jgi:hypothetical protein